MAHRGRGAQAKGKQFERDVAKKVQSVLGIEMRRTPSNERWKTRGGDVNPRNYFSIAGRFHWELKNQETWKILDWFKKASDDAEELRTPLVVVSRNREREYVFLTLDDFLRLLVELQGYEGKTEGLSSGLRSEHRKPLAPARRRSWNRGAYPRNEINLD